MSIPNQKQNNEEYFEEKKREFAKEVGMVYSGRNSDGEMEFIGTTEKWGQFLEKLNELENI